MAPGKYRPRKNTSAMLAFLPHIEAMFKQRGTEFVLVGTNLDTGEAEFSTRYRLSRKTYVEATTTPRSSAADIFYSWELE